MPLIHSSSESALRENIATEVRARGPENTQQAVAIALNTGRHAWREKHPTGPFPHHLRKTGVHRSSRKRNRAGAWVSTNARGLSFSEWLSAAGGSGHLERLMGKDFKPFDAWRRGDDPGEYRNRAGTKRPKKRALTVFERHQLKIARDTLRMPDAMVGVMGGPSKEQARQIIRELTGEEPNRAYPISYSDGRSIADPIVMIWDDLSTERRGNWYRAFWQESLESTTGSPVFGYASGQGGPHRTQRAAANEVWRYYPEARVYGKSGLRIKKK